MAAISWNTGISGNWSQASDWSSGTVPVSTDDVTISAAGTYTVTINSTYSVNSLTFNAPNAIIGVDASDYLYATGATITGGTIDGPGTLYEYYGGVWTISASAPLTLGGGLLLRIYYTNAVVNDAGTINVGDAAGLTATIENYGNFNLTTDTAGIGLNSVNVGGALHSGIGNFENFGTLAKTGGTGTSHISASYSTTSGKISVSTGTLEFDGPSNNFSSGTISGTGADRLRRRKQPIQYQSGDFQFPDRWRVRQL